jgi:hypothetical protein
MDCFSFPIKFSSGRLKTLTQGDYNYYRQILTLALLTEVGEHPITPDFGVLDPTFISIEPIDFVLNAARFLPEVEILGINPSLTEDGSMNVEFDFRLRT